MTILHIIPVVALVEKGILTDDDLARARIKATSLIDQEVARQTEAAQEEFDKQYPGLRNLLGLATTEKSPDETHKTGG